MDLLTRLKTYMSHVGMPSSQFADVAQIPRPTLSQILSGRNRKISNELLEKLHAAFPRLNVSWLLFGDGEMEINGIPQVVRQPRPQEPTPIKEEKETEAPTLPIDQISEVPKEQFEPKPKEKGFEPLQPVANPPVSLNTDSNKKIQTIMVFYSDNSFEIFRPSER